MYDSMSRITFSMKHDTSRQQRFQIYGEEEYTPKLVRERYLEPLEVNEEDRLAVLTILK